MSHAKQSDWFMPAMRQLGGVSDDLGQVIRIEQQRLAFAQGLQNSLCQYAGKSSDSLTELKRRGRELKQTLDLRLGILSPDREAPWFRSGALLEAGPFAPRLNHDPILLAFPPQHAVELKSRLAEAWHAGITPDFTFLKQGPCLWLELLEQNCCFQRILRIKVLTKSYSLLDLPEQLPGDLDSPSLRLFLHNVNLLASAVREQLQECYLQLYEVTATFLDKQQERAIQAEAEKLRQSRLRSSARGADDIREHLRNRRQEKWLRLADEDQAALAILEFEDWPDAQDLKKKFRELAMRYHPDRDSGDEDLFRKVNAAYQRLQEKVR